MGYLLSHMSQPTGNLSLGWVCYAMADRERAPERREPSKAAQLALDFKNHNGPSSRRMEANKIEALDQNCYSVCMEDLGA